MFAKLQCKNRAFTFFKNNKRQFNHPTLYNAHQYLIQNKGMITFQKNESGFIRMTFPDSVLVPDEKVPALETGEVLRANFWFYKAEENGLGDESIHDHPRAFQSYIVAGGYEHVIYSVVDDPQKIFRFNFRDFVQKNILPNFGISSPLYSSDYLKSFKFALDKSINTISYKGTTILEESRVESTKKGDIVEIDTKLIHRVTKYHMFAEEKTLSLNIVRNQGKMITNIFLPEMKVASVKTEREDVSPEEALMATDELITLLSKHF